MSVRSVIANIARQPSLTYYYAQKAVRWLPLRDALGGIAAALLPQASASVPRVHGAAEVAQQLRTDGVSFLPQLQLNALALSEIRAFLRGKPTVDWYDNSVVDVDGPVARKHTKLSYRTKDLVTCMPLLELANSPLILDAVTEILGARPTIAWFQSWWTFGEHHEPGKTHFDDVYHRDVDDLRFIKLFVYLTDTDVRNGAHSFVRGSHSNPTLTRRGPIADTQVSAAFPSQDVLTIKGAAGTVFLENTWGIHRPLLATEGRRLIFSALYSLTPWVPRGINEHSDAQRPRGFDAYVNRVLFK